jgi:hypothetical protein
MPCNKNVASVGIEKISSESLYWAYGPATLQKFISHNIILPKLSYS